MTSVLGRARVSLFSTHGTQLFGVLEVTYWYILFLLQGHLLLPETISELVDAFVHCGHLRVALVQALSLLLQLGILFLVQLVPQLNEGTQQETLKTADS